MKQSIVTKKEDSNLFGILIRKEKETGFLNLSDLREAYTQARVKNGWVEKNIGRILLSMSFRSWFEGTFGVHMPSNIGSAYLKENGFQITTGARSAKCVWVHEEIFNYVEDRLFNNKETIVPFGFENRCTELFSIVFSGIIPFIAQYKVLNYRVDYYFESLNLCVEFDESYHESKFMKSADIDRQCLIEKELSCKFVRGRIGEEFLLINNILKFKEEIRAPKKN